MLYHKDTIKAACAAVSKDETRPALQCVYLDEKRAVATDGHILIELPRGEWVADEFPQIDGEGVTRTNGQPVAVPADTLLAVANTCPKREHFPILHCIRIVDGDKKGEVEIASTDLNSVTRKTTRINEDYPDFDKAILEHAEKRKPLASFALSIPVLNKMLKALTLAGCESIILEPTKEENGPIRVIGFEGMLNEKVGRAIIMPLRSTLTKEVDGF